MQRLNSIDAIAPAFSRAHELLFKPFRVGRSWKLASSCYLALAGSVFVPIPLLVFAIPYLPSPQPTFRVIALAFVAVYSLVVFAFFYLGARMSFVTFEMLVTRQVFIAPMWRRYGSRVWPWIGLKAAVGTVLTAAMLPLLGSIGKGFFSLVVNASQLPKGEQPDPAFVASLMQHVMGFYGGMILFFLILKLASTLLDDFVQPFFQLEPISLAEALRRGFNLFTRNFLDCFLYVLLKYILAIVGYLMQTIAFQLCFFVVALVFGIVGFLGWALLHLFGTVGTVLMVAGGVVLGLALLTVFFYLTIGVTGYLMMLLDAYAIYFLGDRYPLLGTLLEPGPGGTFTPPPVFPSPEETNDRGGGPPMSMNPAVA
jgi:hypothetical protein